MGGLLTVGYGAVLFRFCLYGFLKNQRYFEPFLMLVLLNRGLPFVTIGALFAVREVVTNLLEVLSGAVADTWGRRRAMIASFSAYLASFVLFAHPFDLYPEAMLAVAMGFYGIGDAFRSGTHKAMIFTWLRAQGREVERTQIYGVTRSWSKIGSAAGVVIGATWVLVMDDMDHLFLLALVPYTLGIVNLLGYPKHLDGEQHHGGQLSIRDAARHLWASLRDIVGSKPLRGLMLESSGFMGTFKATKDYLQPVLQAAAATTAFAALGVAGLGEQQRTALLVGPVYVVLFLWSAAMSRRAGDLVNRAKGEDGAARWLWLGFAASFAALLVAALLDLHLGLILGFMALYALEALWRPVVVSRFDIHGSEHQGATLLSVESQVRSLSTMILAPLLGALVDYVTLANQPPWWPVAALGAVVGALFVVRALRRARESSLNC